MSAAVQWRGYKAGHVASHFGLNPLSTNSILFIHLDEYEEDSLETDLGQVGNHAFARMEGDVDKQRKLILQGQLSEAAMQKQHQRK